MRRSEKCIKFICIVCCAYIVLSNIYKHHEYVLVIILSLLIYSRKKRKFNIIIATWTKEGTMDLQKRIYKISEMLMVFMSSILLITAVFFAYSFSLKEKTIIDVVILSLGFVLRVLYGGVIVQIPVSAMLVLTVFMFSLYMVMGKRRNEKRKLATETRDVLKLYSDAFLDRNMYMCLTIGIVFYSIWALSLNQYMIYTTIFVVIICMRYNFILESDSLGDPVDVIFADKFLLGLIIIFGSLLVKLLQIK